jgi:hypothetical protein
VLLSYAGKGANIMSTDCGNLINGKVWPRYLTCKVGLFTACSLYIFPIPLKPRHGRVLHLEPSTLQQLNTRQILHLPLKWAQGRLSEAGTQDSEHKTITCQGIAAKI